MIYFFVVGRVNELRVVAISGHGGGVSTSDFSSSRLRLYNGGAFTLDIKTSEDQIFTAVGHFTRSGNSQITFNFVDVWTDDSQNTSLIGTSQTFNISNRRIRFIDHMGRIFYFG